jgi:DNA polymerase III sliding clamp (beta) subunit (PCNA family)
MLKELKFVMGAVAKKDLIPAMTHFCIEKGRIRSYNGLVALSSPIPFDIDCIPKAETLYNAIVNCEDTISLYMTPGGKLGVKSGAFRALVPCIEESTVHVEPDGDIVQLDGEVLLKALKVMEPIIGDDAARPWQAGILLKGQSAFATCNVVLVEYWLGVDFGHVVNIPGLAVREMIRINEPPTHAQLTDTSITFHYTDGRWVRTQMLPTNWPDFVPILERPSNQEPIDDQIFEALERLKKFTDKLDRIYFTDGLAHTVTDPEDGVSFRLAGSKMKGVYCREMLCLLKGLATTIDFSTWPKACMFQGNRLRGAIIGMQA